MTDYLLLKNPILFAVGFFLLLFVLASCQSERTPIETTQLFWSAIVEDDLAAANKFCNTQSFQLPSSLSGQLKGVSFEYGRIVIDGNESTVETKLTTSSQQDSSFSTFLVKKKDAWTIDCQRSTSVLAGNYLFKEFFSNLNELGKNINKQLEQQIPLIEKEIESFGEELKQQIDNFGRELEKSLPQQKQPPPQDTI